MGKREVQRATGLYRNGLLWWMRVRDPQTRVQKPRSTGTNDLRLANAIVAMVHEFGQDRTEGWDWLARAVSGEATLLDIYNYRVRSALHDLRAILDNARRAAKDEDLRDWLDRWLTDVLPKRVTNRGGVLNEKQRAEYERQLRAIIPEGEPTRSSALTEEYLSSTLDGLGLAPNTKRNYVTAWRLFVRWARRKGAPITGDPFEYAEEWVPGPGKPRMKVWSHTERLAVLAEMQGFAKAAIALMLGSGMELSAILRLRGKDVSYDDSRTVFADGTKSDFRKRHVRVDAWAWEIFLANVPRAIGAKKVFPWSEGTKGAALRESFYRAQVRAGLCEEPPKSEKGYSLWDSVDVHTIHDCRHTYAVCRSFGLDGEDRQETAYISDQLGHANEVMVTRIYKALSAARRRQLLTEAEKLRRVSQSA